MLSKSNNRQLIDRGLDPKLVLFYQVWQELTYRWTIDTYKNKIFNTLNILQETVDVAEKTLAKIYLSYSNIQQCLAETLYIINHDNTLEKHYPTILHMLRRNLSGLGSKDSDLKRIIAHLKNVITKLDASYIENLLTDLRTAINDGSEKEIMNLTNCMVSIAIQHGWSSSELFNCVNILLESEEINIKWEKFVSKIFYSEEQERIILINTFFKIKSEGDTGTVFRNLSRLGVEIKSCDDFKEDYPDFADKLSPKRRYMLMKVSAYDDYSAAHKAIRGISDSLNILSFYNFIEYWDLKDIKIHVLNKQTKENRTIHPNDLYKTYNSIDSSNKVFARTCSLLVQDNQAIKERILNSFGYTNMSQASLLQEEKFMNAWVALESLTRTQIYNDIISAVKNVLPQAHCKRYLFRIIKDFIEDCIRCEVDLGFVMSGTGDKVNRAESVKKIMTEINDPLQLARYIEKCSVNSLLSQRLVQIQSLLSDIKTLANRIDEHKERLTWQIQRLYRIRNQIAHSALYDTNLLISYIEHLYDYIFIFTNEVIVCVVDKKVTNIDEALCILKENYDEFKFIASDKKTAMTVNDLICGGIINMI